MFVEISKSPELIVTARANTESGKQAKEKINTVLKKAYDAGVDEESCEESVASLCAAAWNTSIQGGPYARSELCVRDKNHTECGIF